MKNKPRRQHYIPRFYLKEFATDETYGKKSQEQVHIYDKKTEKTELRNIKSIAYKPYLYSPKDSSGYRSLYMEEKLKKIEDVLSLIWNDFSNKFIDLENYNTKKVIALFLSSLILRHPKKLQEYDNIREFLHNDIVEHNPPNNQNISFIIDGKEHSSFNIDELKNSMSDYARSMFFIENIDYFTSKYSEIFMKKKWSIITSEEKVFITSDNPIIIHNSLTDIFGLNTKGTIILFPVSPRRLLFLEDYVDSNEKKDMSYRAISKEHHSYYNHIIWHSSDSHVISNQALVNVVNDIYDYARNEK